uniref:Aa_trans domain-containing protein n=1 Tax=Panagrellus redivivus TaxID=6233 RepID=A0A7E4VV90_PANRE
MPSSFDDGSGQTFSTTVGLLYVFNLIVGTGALALPKAFQTSGYVLGSVLLAISAFVSYMCATFIVEAMSVSNAILKLENTSGRNSRSSNHGDSGDEGDDASIQQYGKQKRSFEITKRVELSEMAYLLLGKVGVILTYIILTMYLFGDLAIYSTTVPKSLMNILCESPNTTEINGQLPCYESHLNDLSRMTVYRVCVVIFASACLPLVLIGMARTKYIQLATTVSRWTAFLLMIALASIQLIQKGPEARPPAANIHGFGSLFGVAIYAFMCHHSIPGLLTPIRNKNNFNYKLIGVYVVIFAFYCTLSITGSFAFHTVQDVYTLNFFHDDTSLLYGLIDHFLVLFPVFTLTSSYIIVAITLSNNIRVLISMVTGEQSTNVDNTESEALLDSGSEDASTIPLRQLTTPSPAVETGFLNFAILYLVPFVAILLPTMLSLFKDDVLILASVTGSYPGVGVQFVIPSLLVIGARRYVKKNLHSQVPQTLRSPFSHGFWPFATLGWALFVVVMVTVHFLHFG